LVNGRPVKQWLHIDNAVGGGEGSGTHETRNGSGGLLQLGVGVFNAT
jgi:hypothetical protein